MRVLVGDPPNTVGRELADTGISNAVKVEQGWHVFCPEDKVGDVIATLASAGFHLYGVDPVPPKRS